MWTYILILLLQLGELIEIKMVGTISVAGIFYIIWFFYNAVTGKWAIELRSGLLLKISILYFCLFFFQLISEVLVGNDLSNTMKGLAVTILSYMKLLCLWPLVKHDRNRLIWLFGCMVISGAISFQFLSDSEFHMESLLNGTEYSIFKFKIAPLFGELLVIYSMLKSSKGLVTWLSFLIGAVCIVLGARSTGLMIFLTGAIVYAINHMKRVITRAQVVWWSIGSGVVCYGLFVLYVTAVLNGTIIGGNSSSQFVKARDPYNPIHLLLAGRTEFVSACAAIYDCPLTGFGAWAKDPGYKYHRIASLYQGRTLSNDVFVYSVIPTHSVILGTGVNEGIFAMVIILMIHILFIAKGFRSLKRGNKYNYLVVFCIMQLIWNGLFSPVSHFRNGFPIYFCCCLFAYRQAILLKNVKRIRQ